MTHTKITNPETGLTFNVRLIRTGERYGRNFAFIHDGFLPIVEFYDVRYPHTPYGQFVSRYNINTLCDNAHRGGVQLEGGVSDWCITETNLIDVCRWAALQEWQVTHA